MFTAILLTIACMLQAVITSTATPVSYTHLDVYKRQVLRDAIRHERRVERAVEPDRFYDLVRWGIAKEVLQAAGKNYQDVYKRQDLGSTKNVRAVQLNFYDHKAVQYNRAMDIYHPVSYTHLHPHRTV